MSDVSKLIEAMIRVFCLFFIIVTVHSYGADGFDYSWFNSTPEIIDADHKKIIAI